METTIPENIPSKTKIPETGAVQGMAYGDIIPRPENSGGL